MRRLLVCLLALTAPLAGACGSEAVAPCASDAQCLVLDDGDRCNGGYACVDGGCRFTPGVTCDPKDDSQCAHNACDPATGECAIAPRNTGLGCDDGAPCTLGDTCKAGVCEAGATDVCDCATTADCADDGDLCNGTPICDTSGFPYRCVTNPATVVTCKADTDPCTVATCAPKTGACAQEASPDGAACDDGDACTAGDTCTKGTCEGGSDVCSCSDDSDCDDEDGDPCTGVPFCDKSGGKGVCKTNPATVVSCSSKADTDCVKNTCDKATGACKLGPVKDDTACDDGDACTKGDVCVAGTCSSGTDTCTCSSDSDCKGSDDGDLCNGLPFCNKASGKCETNPATVVVCPTVGDTDCAKNVCQPKTGKCAVMARAEVALVGCVDVDLGGLVGKQCLWKPAPKASTAVFPCEDGDACTAADSCAGKSCKAGKVVCACTQDSDCVDPDGDVCTGVPFCDKAVGKCLPNKASAVYCSTKDDTACEKALCDPKTGSCGLKPVAAGGPCDDGKPCTAKDGCDGKGGCVGGGKTSCDDKNPCTVDSCDDKSGCVHKAKDCDDGNVCTKDVCVAGTGQCGNTPKAKGVPCNADDNGCTVADSCDGGVCKAGPPLACSGATGPCTAWACVAQGASSGKCALVPKADKTPCPDKAGACLVGAACVKGKCVPGTTPRTFVTPLSSPGTYEIPYALAAVGDGTVVVVGAQRVDPKVYAKGNRWTTRRVSGVGAVLWTKTTQGASPSIADRARAVAVTDDGVVWTGGVLTSGTSAPAIVERRALDGGLIDKLTVQNYGKTTAVRGLAVAPQGGVALGVTYRYSTSSTDYGRVVRLASDGTKLWDSQNALSTSTRAIHDVAATTDQIIAIYKVKSGYLRWGYTVFDQASGKEIETVLPGTASTWSPTAVATVGPRVMFTAVSASTHFLEVGTDGETVHEGYLPAPTRAYAIAGRPASAGWLLAGWNGASGSVTALDAFNNPQWTRTVPGSSILYDVVAAGEDVLAVGYKASGGTASAVLVRTGPHGHVGCSGACASVALKSCDDGKPCTTDDCDPKTGCQHAVPKGLVCDPKDGCSNFGVCNKGVCGPSGNGRRFNRRRSWTIAKGSELVNATPLSEGKVRVVTLEGAVFRHSHYSAFAATSSPESAALCSGFSAIHHVTTRFDGSVRLSGTTGVGSAARAAHCAMGFDPDEGAIGTFKRATTKVVAESTACTTCASALHAAHEALDGTVFGAGVIEISGGKRALMTRRSAVDKPLWSASHAGVGGAEALGVRGLPDGTGVAVGAVGSPGSRKAAAFAVEFDGKTRFVATWVAAADAVLHDVALTGAKQLVAVGHGAATSGARARLVIAFDPTTGKQLWSSLAQPSDLASGLFVRSDGLGGATLSGDLLEGGRRKVFIERMDPQGGVLWRRTYTSEYNWDVRATAMATWAQGYLVAWRVLDKTGADTASDYPGMLKTGPAGYAGCAIGGKCMAKSTADCDDNKPCTADWCDAKTGCKHVAIQGCKAP